ncbi:MAG: transcription termination/antitermination NusG family protein, partial [Pseudomonadales bacterium]
MNSAPYTPADERKWLAQSQAKKRRVEPYRAPSLPLHILRWVAVRTRPKMEARAIDDLLELNIRAYCPHGLYERRVGKARRREDFTRPLFTSYVLAGLDPEEPPLGVVVGL